MLAIEELFACFLCFYLLMFVNGKLILCSCVSIILWFIPCGFSLIVPMQEYAAEACQSESEVTHPPSPDASYSRNSIIDLDFSKPPPDLPPQLHRTLLNESSNTDCYQFPTRPRHVALNHLYMKSCDRGQAIAFGSTHRFLEKYVTVILYKPSWRQVKER